jgi:hypothetical protein
MKILGFTLCPIKSGVLTTKLIPEEEMGKSYEICALPSLPGDSEAC